MKEGVDNMYEITIKLPKKRIGVVNRIRKVLQSSYENANVKNKGQINETIQSQGGSMKELGIEFEIKSFKEGGIQ